LLWFPFLIEKTVRIISQRQCLNHTAPPSTVAFDLDAGLNIVARPRPPCLDRLVRSSHVGPIDGSVLFLHERHVPGGPKRLIAITPGRFERDSLETRVAELWTFRYMYFRSINRVNLSPIDGMQSLWQAPFRIFEGQPDSAGPTHFTIEFESGRKHGTIDGWLKNDEYVVLEVRQPPPGGK
jgi:hypothetical protein